MSEGALGVHFEASLPMRVATLSGLPSPESLAGFDHKNESLLRTLLAIDERPGGDLADEEPGLALELSRLDHKLNLLIGLVTQLVRRDDQQFDECQVQMGATRIGWAGDRSSDLQGCIQLSVVLPGIDPNPLVLHGKVAESGAADAEGWCFLDYQGMSPAVAELLEKYIFRQHRRAIAIARAKPE